MSWHEWPLRISGRWVSPIFLLVAATAALGGHYVFQRAEIRQQVAAAESGGLKERLAIAQARLNLQIGLDNPLAVRRLVTELALHAGLERAYLVAADGLVEASLSRAELGQRISQVLRGGQLPDDAMNEMLGLVATPPMRVQRPGDQAWLVGGAPIDGNRRLLVAVDLSLPMATRIQSMERDLLREGFLLLVSTVVLALLLHVLWFRRAEQLVDALRQMGQGQLNARAGLVGRDELAQIGQAADQMAVKLKATIQRLEHLNRVIDQSPVIVVEWVYTAGWELSFVSDSVRQWGYTPGEWLDDRGRAYVSMVHPVDRVRVQKMVAAHLRNGPDEFDVEARIKCRDGTWAEVESRIAMERDEKGWVTTVSSIVLDVTGRKAIERERQQQESLIRMFFDLPFIGMCITDPASQRFLQVNDRFCEILGYSRVELLDLNWVALTVQDDVARNLELNEQLLSGESDGFHLQKRYRRKDGSIVEVEIEVKAVRDADGLLRYTMTTVEDVSERVQREQALKFAKDELERRVKERTADLTNANRELEAFTYTVSHDLKSPLRGIEGFSALLLESHGSTLDATGRHYLERIQKGVVRMGNLIQDLLDYSRLDRREMDMQEIFLPDLVTDLLVASQADIDRHRTLVVNEVEPLRVLADREGIKLALRNLVDNAIKFSGQSSQPRIEVGASRMGHQIRIWVKDNGVGFDMQYHDKMFGIFQRLHPMETYPGTGVGLALVAKAMQRMGGKAWADSSPGQGATFFVELPGTH